MTNATPMDISRLVSHLTKVVATERESVSTLLHELQPLKERIIVLKDECDEKKKVYKFTSFARRIRSQYLNDFFSLSLWNNSVLFLPC